MRQREIIWQGWRVRWECQDGELGHETYYTRKSAERYLAALHLSGVTDVRVHRVTRYRLAPLVEIAAWRGGYCGSGEPGQAGAMAFGADEQFKAWDGVGTHIEGRGGRREAEAHLAVLGYRVKKEKRR